jgi:hypothetical protein
MDWLKEAVKNYDKLSESEQAHVDAALDSIDAEANYENTCMCGEKIDSCPEAYEHMTGGY